MPYYPPSGAAAYIGDFASSTVTSGDQTASIATINLPAVTLQCSGIYPVRLTLSCIIAHTNAGSPIILNPQIDSTTPTGLVNTRVFHTPNVAGGQTLAFIEWLFPAPSAGSHTFRWVLTSGGVGTCTVSESVAQPLIVEAQEVLG